MSNPEKAKMDTEEEVYEYSDESDYLWSDEEGDIRDIVLALPALRISESPNVDEAIRQKAAAAAELVAAAAQEAAVTKGKVEEAVVGETGEPLKKKKGGRTKKPKLGDLVDTADASGSNATALAGEEDSAKKPKKKGSSKLTNPPEGPPKCNICGRSFVSWKAVFGHLRAHKDRGYLGFLPPPSFNAAQEGFGGVVTASSGGGGFGLGPTGLQIDLNADPIDDEEESGPVATPRFDLNRSPPQDDVEEEKKDKAE